MPTDTPAHMHDDAFTDTPAHIHSGVHVQTHTHTHNRVHTNPDMPTTSYTHTHIDTYTHTNRFSYSHSLLQGIFPTQGSNPGLPHCRQILYPLSHQGSPRKTHIETR